MTIASDIQTLAPSGMVELFELDATVQGGPVLHFHAGTNQLTQPVVWNGVTYIPWPIQVTGWTYTVKGTQPRPTMKVANVTAYLSAVVINYNDILGAKVTRKRTLVKYLDAVNFPGGVNPTADPTAAFADDVYYINRKSNETKLLVEFELAPLTDVAGVLLPRRQIINNVCPWKYRGAECSYAGGPVATADDVPTTDADLDACGKRLNSCKLRFGNFAELPFGGFPAAGLV
jgi:lambda family phage minor tail protein L